MKNRKLAAGVAGLCLAVGVSGVAVAANTAATPKKATIKAIQSFKMKPNRYIQDGSRWDKDIYKVRPGGTVTLVNNAPDAGPHTLTAVKKSDLPKTAAQAFNCKTCNELGEAHGADPNSDAPPTFMFLENGVGSEAPPKFDRPGDSALAGPNKGDKMTFDVTAKKGSKLYMLCLIHPWMQARVDVVG